MKTILETGKNKTRFSRHFAKCYEKEYGTKEYSVKKLKKLVRHEVIWEGNALSVVKTFGSDQCRLCAEEKFCIWEDNCRNFRYMLNKRQEIYGACAHNVHFHCFYRGTDESTRRDEKEN